MTGETLALEHHQLEKTLNLCFGGDSSQVRVYVCEFYFVKLCVRRVNSDVYVCVTSGLRVALVQAGQMGPWREKAMGKRRVLF